MRNNSDREWEKNVAWNFLSTHNIMFVCGVSIFWWQPKAENKCMKIHWMAYEEEEQKFLFSLVNKKKKWTEQPLQNALWLIQSLGHRRLIRFSFSHLFSSMAISGVVRVCVGCPWSAASNAYTNIHMFGVEKRPLYCLPFCTHTRTHIQCTHL